MSKKITSQSEDVLNQMRRRTQVLEAAEDCFRKEGFHGTSIQKISKASKMSPGHIYHYFENKEAIINGLVETSYSRAAAHIANIENQSKELGPLEALSNEMERVVATRTNPRYASLELEFLAEAARNKDVSQFVEKTDKFTRARVKRVLAQIPSLKRMSPEELDAYVDFITMISDGLVIRGVSNPKFNKKEITKIMKNVLAFLLK